MQSERRIQGRCEGRRCSCIALSPKVRAGDIGEQIGGMH